MNSKLLTGIPLLHHPMFMDIWKFHTYSDEMNRIATSLNRDGFVIFDFPEPNFDEIAENIKTAISPKFNWERWKSGDLYDLRIQDAWSFCPQVKDLAANREILDMLSALYGRKAIPFQTLNFGVGTQQAPHSDHPHFHSIPEKFMCGVWIALEDVDERNGALIYYPGSQNWIQLENQHFSVDPEDSGDNYSHYQKYVEAWQLLAKYNNVSPKIAKLKKGQAVIWTANVVHGGGTILDRSLTRWSQVTHYFFDDCVYTTPLANNQAKGKVFYRQITDIGTGNIIQNKSCSEPLALSNSKRRWTLW